MKSNTYNNNVNGLNYEIRVNDKKRTIEMTKKFAEQAQFYGNSAYDKLQEVRSNYPTYRVEVVKTANKGRSFKGLTLDYMENYIIAHGDKEELTDFYTLCGRDVEGNDLEVAQVAAYGSIKSWFVENHPELKLNKSTIDDILKKSKMKKAAAEAQAEAAAS